MLKRLLHCVAGIEFEGENWVLARFVSDESVANYAQGVADADVVGVHAVVTEFLQNDVYSEEGAIKRERHDFGALLHG